MKKIIGYIMVISLFIVMFVVLAMKLINDGQ